MTDPTTTPAATLRAAAGRVRKLAHEATPGPWAEPYYDDNPGDEGWWVLNGREGMREHAVVVTFALNPHAEADARWIAAMSPAIAEPLAALLESFVPGLERSLALFDGEFPPDIEQAVREGLEAPLALARAILAAAPTPSPSGSNPGGGQ